MIEFPVIFCIAVVGSLVRWSAGLALKLAAPKAQSESIAVGPHRGWSTPVARPVDPVLRFGLILACDGVIVLTLVSAFPGPLALERTGLTFALLCVGGLIGEISSTGTTTPMPNLDAAAVVPAQRRPVSRRLSVVLTLILNLSFAVLSTGQGLIDIVPPAALSAAHAQELDPVIVVARRTYDPLDERSAAY
jgi:hypothetical protein